MIQYYIDQKHVRRVYAAVYAAFPREACGLLLREGCDGCARLGVEPTATSENTPISFRIRDAAISTVAGRLDSNRTRICGCFHSHVIGPARPSSIDRRAQKEPGALWLIYGLRSRALELYQWDGDDFVAQLLRIGEPPAPHPDHDCGCGGGSH